MKKRYAAMVFDLDGTLLDSRQDITLATNATIVAMGGRALPEETVARFVGRGVRELIRDALAAAGAAHRQEEAVAFFRTYYLEHCLDHSVLFPGAREILAELNSRGVGLAVLTNKPQVYTDKILSILGVAGVFGSVLGAEAGHPHKPDPSGCLSILETLGASPAESLLVGDSVVDLKTAENAGMDCVLALNGFSERDEILSLKDRAVRLYEDLEFLLDVGRREKSLTRSP